MFLTDPQERNRFLKFAVVGFIGAAVDFGVANLLRSLGAVLVVAGTISFIAAILSNFTWNRYWTYPDSRSKSILLQLGEFGLVSVIGLAIRIPILAFLGPWMFVMVSRLPVRFPMLATHTVSDNLTLAVAVIVVMFWNFFVNRFWTYGDVDQA